jgi:hypothetical protein
MLTVDARLATGSSHIGEHEVLKAELFDHPDRVIDRTLASDNEAALHVGVVFLDDLLVRRERLWIAARSDDPTMGGKKLLNVPCQLDLRGGEDNQVVTNSLQVTDKVGREHNTEVVLGDGGHEELQELAASEWIKARDRLVKDEQLRTFGNCHRERKLSSLTSRELAGALLWIKSEFVDPPLCQVVVPPWIEPAAKTEMVINGQSGVSGGVLGDESDTTELGGFVARSTSENFDRACRRSNHPDGEVQQRGLACPVRTD